MIILLFLIFFLALRNFYRSIRKKKVSYAKKIIFNKNNLNNWMNLTKKERYNLSKEESVSNLMRRKVLLKEIRKEYKKISKGTGKKN